MAKKYGDMYPAEKKRALARNYARVYLLRGKIERKPCENCGDPVAQMHHEDYDKPLEVRWLCRKCHVKHHADEAAAIMAEYS